ncbi:acetyl-CoA carboxylase biotin carboxyl carrier protein subunit [Enterococcus pallens]|uniref:Acetyl-CoA carboxylase biotin carboxyl carrier protein subunit n=1 Tax=Enterococcus pallens ATCC BAA-351 TaxID=1158607 RepID=R2SRB8_9ENTE|nr:acetyl-CoA carboxylase biotin carboxyl carrier protein subunit [Enterococcus pallens]EOH97805.1 acetyl-CoA carboxylase biotin carboxyl carrier protein subunit [Enterococcus pallens ATCC BAA-351]EOU20776.1 acetyl-CoA carboxylase biotin carboxyl carrier protein subunit [Enterococcus pallens ATCC BAA-351]OJG79262.1 acetyl-CoA carboxylase biotin carboxyl carrier protein subunit [Enterococcus pallens]
MLRKFKISIDGQEYLVEMEEIGGVPQPAPAAPAAPAPAAAEPVQAAAPAAEAPAAPAAASAPAGADALTAPMPGAILKILVNVGDAVKQNQPLMILEAMKMENEIVASSDGTVTGIHVQQGDVVNPGDPLITVG